MKLIEAINFLGTTESKKIGRQAAWNLEFLWDDCIDLVFQICLSDLERCPKIGNDKDSAENAISKWVKKYKDGYDNRPSKSKGKPPQTISDEIIDEMIRARVNPISQEKIEEVRFAHRLSMSAENILGLFLEEYVAFKLKQYGWACAWGQTLKSVDLCHKNGNLLQIKNRSNTENSSSNKIRKGTKIKKWHRVDANSGRYFWDDLEKQTGAKVSELEFREFVVEAIKNNPNSLPLDLKSPWLSNRF